MKLRSALPLTAILGLSIAGQTENSVKEAPAKAEVTIERPSVEVTLGEGVIVRQEYLNQRVPLDKLVRDYQAKHGKHFKRTIIVEKSDRMVSVYANDTVLKIYGMSLGFTPKGTKRRRGDGKTPEGKFYVARKLPNSNFFKALLINYPDKKAAARGIDKGWITPNQYRQIREDIDNCRVPLDNTRLGSMIELHGSGGGPGYQDWTWGCVALNNDAMLELYNFARVGCFPSGNYRTTIHIKK